jgi:hypothetical protein
MKLGDCRILVSPRFFWKGKWGFSATDFDWRISARLFGVFGVLDMISGERRRRRGAGF